MKKRSITINGTHSSVSLEDCFWEAFKTLAEERLTTISALAGEIKFAAGEGNMSSAIRVYLFEQYKRQASEPAS